MIIKTAELEGATLDWAVAKVVGLDGLKPSWTTTDDGDAVCWLELVGLGAEGTYSPSRCWSSGGPLIEEFDIDFIDQSEDSNGNAQHNALCMNAESFMFSGGSGPTRLIAAMRAIVTAKLGDEVDIPNELVNR